MYRVYWLPAALNQLATIWLDAGEDRRREINESVRRIDGLLASGPVGVGESRSEGERICFVSALSVVYRVDEDAQTVAILSVRVIRRRSGSNGQH